MYGWEGKAPLNEVPAVLALVSPYYPFLSLIRLPFPLWMAMFPKICSQTFFFFGATFLVLICFSHMSLHLQP